MNFQPQRNEKKQKSHPNLIQKRKKLERERERERELQEERALTEDGRMVCGKGSKRASLMSSSPRRDDSVLISRQCRCNNMGFGSGLRKQLGSLKTKRTTNAVVSAWERERTGQGGGSSGEGDGSVFSNKVFRATAGFVASTLLGFSLYGAPAEARLEGVNKPELLPKEYSPLIDVADFLTSGEEERVIKTLERLEKDTGVKLRVLAQNYPETPGLAIKEFWKVDSNTVVLVADPNTGNITNFNVGDDVDFQVPRVSSSLSVLSSYLPIAKE